MFSVDVWMRNTVSSRNTLYLGLNNADAYSLANPGKILGVMGAWREGGWDIKIGGWEAA